MKLCPRYAGAVALLGWYLMVPPQPILPNPANSGKSTADLLEENERAWNWIRSGHHDPNEPTPIRPYLIGAPDDDAPISQWGTLDVFDSAAACKAAIEAGQGGLDAVQKQVEKYVHDKETVASQRADIRAMYAHAQCIASDDPRLKGK